MGCAQSSSKPVSLDDPRVFPKACGQSLPYSTERYTDPDVVFQCGSLGADVQLLSLNWLLNHATTGQPLPRRQDCPPEAFMSAQSLLGIWRSAPRYTRNVVVPVVSVSHIWLTREHPDPSGEQLRQVAEVLFEQQIELYGTVFEDMGVFIDWSSLHQPDPATGTLLPAELDSRERALKNTMDIWFAHSCIATVFITRPPAGVDARPADERGWPTFERCASELVRPSKACAPGTDASRWSPGLQLWSLSVEVDDVGRRRRPPTAPSAFRTLLSGKTFARHADQETALALFTRMSSNVLADAAAFKLEHGLVSPGAGGRIGAALRMCRGLGELELSSTAIDPDELQAALDAAPFEQLRVMRLEQAALAPAGGLVLANALAAGTAPRLLSLALASNKLGGTGGAAIAAALTARSLPRLRTLSLGGNELGPVGGEAVGLALTQGATPELQVLGLDDNEIGAAGVRALGGALECGSLPLLAVLGLSGNALGEDGGVALASALGKRALARLRVLGLNDNALGADGAEALAAALGRGAAPALRTLCLNDNSIGRAGASALGCALLKDGAVALERLELMCNDIGEKGAAALVAALDKGGAPGLVALDLDGNDLDAASTDLLDELCCRREGLRVFLHDVEEDESAEGRIARRQFLRNEAKRALEMDTLPGTAPPSAAECGNADVRVSKSRSGSGSSTSSVLSSGLSSGLASTGVMHGLARPPQLMLPVSPPPGAVGPAYTLSSRNAMAPSYRIKARRPSAEPLRAGGGSRRGSKDGGTNCGRRPSAGVLVI